MLTPKYTAKGYYFDENYTDIIEVVQIVAQKLHPEAADKVSGEFISFVAKMSTMSQKREEIVSQMTAKIYWNTIGRREFPALYTVAKTIVEMICSSATAERTWSTFKFIHSRLRNRLTNERVEKLVLMYCNA